MNKFRAWLLIKLAGKDSVVLNSTINLYESGAAIPEIISIAYQAERGTPVLEVQEGGLVAGCNFRVLSGQADRMVNGGRFTRLSGGQG